MRVAFIEAYDPEDKLRKFCNPQQLAYLAGYIENSLDVECIIEDDEENLLRSKPNVVGISSYTINYPRAIEMARTIKSHLDVPVIIGGHHITSLPQSLASVFDIGVLGEGEETILELISLYLREMKFEARQLEKIKGIVYRDHANHDKLKITPPRELIYPLDKLPFPRRELFPLNNRTLFLFTSRGCPFRCIFCFPSKHWQKYRTFSAEYVVSEIKHCIQSAPDFYNHLYFTDDLFIGNKRRLREIADLFIKEGLHLKFKSSGNVRADLLDEETCMLLKRMGFEILSFGAESGSDRVLEFLNKKTTVAHNQRAIDLCHQFGLKVNPFFIIGSPVETKEDLEATYRFIEKNKDRFCGIEIYPLVAFPGTELWDYARRRNLVNEDMDWTRLKLSSDIFDPQKYILLNENLTMDEFYQYVKRFQELYREISQEYLTMVDLALKSLES